MKDLQPLIGTLHRVGITLRHYLPALFGLFLLLIYGFVMYQIQTLNDQAPAASDVAAQSQTAQVPHINAAVITQLKNLQDNSVSVQSLFNTARGNPFQE